MKYETHERLLTVENLTLAYGSKVILRDVTCHVDNIVRPGMQQGQVIALLGLSGSGKTQLFRCISGMQKPTSGTITLNDNRHPVVPGEVGVVQQAYPLLQHRTVWSNLLLATHGKAGGKEQAETLLNHFGLLDKKTSYPLELSGGQRQRIAIIQQLLCSNYFLLMDEPFSGLDLVAKERVFDTIRTVSTANELNTVIFTSHDLESAVTLADQIWIIGKEKDKPGATVIKSIDLAAMDLAWTPDIQRHPKYWPTVMEIKAVLSELA
jgi:ABC-type nitrate/sulfonate/bicarbonate transport system ATPase subunit